LDDHNALRAWTRREVEGDGEANARTIGRVRRL
jgi:hypothetical protein